MEGAPEENSCEKRRLKAGEENDSKKKEKRRSDEDEMEDTQEEYSEGTATVAARWRACRRSTAARTGS